MIKISAENRHIALYFSVWSTTSFMIYLFLPSPASSHIFVPFLMHVSATLNISISFNRPRLLLLPGLCHAGQTRIPPCWMYPASSDSYVPFRLHTIHAPSSPGRLRWRPRLSQVPFLYVISIAGIFPIVLHDNFSCPFKKWVWVFAEADPETKISRAYSLVGWSS